MEYGEFKMKNFRIMRKENILKSKSFSFALRINELYKFLQSEHKEYIRSKQILRSGTSIGALVRESENAASFKDFLNKLNVALKKQMKLNIGLNFYFILSIWKSNFTIL